MKKAMFIILLLAALAVLQAELVDKIIARVGNDIILLSDLTRQIKQVESSGYYQGEVKGIDVLNQMIDSRLIVQKAKELNYTVDESKVQSEAEASLKQLRSKYASEEEFRRELKQMKLSAGEIQKFYEDAIRERELTRQFYQKLIAVKINVSDKEMREFYLEHKDSLAVKPVTWNIGMLLRQVNPSEETEQAKLREIKAIQERLRSGESFASLAETESDCPSSAQGGDLGFVTQGMMVKPFEDAAFALKVGEVSDVVKTQYGFHLIKLEETRNEEIRVRHILRLVEPTAADTLAAQAKMEEIRQEFLGGKSFAELARLWSTDEDTAKDGGGIGEFAEDDFPELFAPYLKTLQVGGITEVLNNEGAFYLFTKFNEIPSRVYSFDEVKDQIREVVARGKQFEVYEDWVDQLRKENYVEIML